MKNPEIVPVTSDLILKYYGRPAHNTMRGIAVVRDDKVLCIGAVVITDGQAFVCSDISDELKKNKRWLILAAREVMKIAASLRLPVFARADASIDRSESFLKHLGFEHVMDRIYRWQPQ